MKFTKKHRKIFYVPGMISLVLIPLLCLWFVNSNRYFQKDYSIDFMISDSISESKPSGNFIYPNDGYVPKRNYISFHFDGTNDDFKLKALVVPLKQMVENNDTIIGFKFSFGKHAKYETFIAAQDLMFINKVNNYTVYKDDIYAFEMPIKKTKRKQIAITTWSCGYATANQDYWTEQARKEARELFIKNIKQFWQIPLVLMGVILLNIFMLIKFNKDRIYNQKSYI